jgi:hypothetical protein
VIENDFGMEALRVSKHAFHQRRALQTFDVSGPIVHVGRGRELTTLFQSGD